MPEVVYTKDGIPWAKKFTYLPDTCDDWIIINSVLEHIAMFNRFGCNKQCQGHEDHRTHYEEIQWGYYRNEVTSHPEKREKTFEYLGMWLFYINEVYSNLGGAYRESSIGL